MLLRIGFIVLAWFTITLHAQNYSSPLRSIYAKVFPKLLLTDTDLHEKLVSDAVDIIVLHDDQDSTAAHRLKESVTAMYPQLGPYELHVSLRTYREFDPLEPASAYFLFRSSDQMIKNVCDVAAEHSILTFAFESSNLDDGAAISLHITKQIVPYISLEALKNSKVELNNLIYDIARVR